MTEYKWHEVYKAALLETDWTKMQESIRAAETALHHRKLQFALDMAERQRKIKPSRMLCTGWAFCGAK